MHEPAASGADQFLTLLKPIERDLEIYCRRLIWAPADAGDAIQNAVLRAYAAFDRYREDASFRAWMFKILTREVFALNRKHARIAHYEVQIDPGDLAEVPEHGSGEALFFGKSEDLLGEEMTASLQALTETERAALLLRAIGEQRYREIADSLNIPIGSVMGNLARARQKMRNALARSARRNNLTRET